MKKIVHIQVLPKLAGVQRVSLAILKGLPEGGYEKWVVFSAPEPGTDVSDLVEAFTEAGVRVVFSEKLRREIGLRDAAALVEIYRLCRRERFDIVHTNSTKPGIVGRIAATLARVPLVIHTVHGLAFHDFVGFPRWQFYWACEMFASMFCHRIVMVNRYYDRYFGWFRRKTSTIYNGIAPPVGGAVANRTEDNGAAGSGTAESGTADSTRHKAHGEGSRVLFVGRLDEVKDPLTLLQAAKIVVGHRPRAHFTLVGDGELRGDCERFVRENDLEGNVTLTGWQSDTASWYARADIFAACSIYESFGLMFLEAGNYSLPIVATRVEGIPEVVADGESGLLCPPRDPKALAAAIERLIDDPALRQRMGRASRLRSQLFSEEKMVSSYNELYETAKS